MILGVVTFARRIARKPVAMINIGVGPLRTRTGPWLARRILSQVDLLTVRDRKSFALNLDFDIEKPAAWEPFVTGLATERLTRASPGRGRGLRARRCGASRVAGG